MSDDQKKVASWKDSNWYVSITGFWGEYRKHRIGILGIIVLVFYVGMAIFAPVFAGGVDPSPSNKVAPPFLAPGWMQVFDPDGVLTDDYMPYPNLDFNPNETEWTGYGAAPNTVITNGTRYAERPDMFDYAYGDGHVNLTWRHTAGDELDFSGRGGIIEEDDPVLGTRPQCYDFIYTFQEFKWTYETMPSDVNMTLELGVKLSGDFATEEFGGQMFKVYVWIIYSSGFWSQVYKSYPPYEAETQNRRIDLSWFDIKDAWLGTQFVNGSQLDPTDNLRVAVGMAPTDLFRQKLNPNNPHEHPYMNYTGEVEVHLETISLVAYGPYYGMLGSTDKGGDAWAQLIYGSRISLIIGILATGLSTAVGVIVGLVAGYFGGKIDEALMRVVDFLLVIPGLPLMMVLAAFLGPTIQNIIVVIAILGWTGTSRLIRSQVMAEKNKAYVESAKAIGASDTYIIFRHILPNVTPILFANITLGVVGAILSESGLAFLGLTDPSEPSWGRMLADAQSAGGFSNGAWWVVVFPGLMITALSLAFTFVGHTLDQVLNPRLRER